MVIFSPFSCAPFEYSGKLLFIPGRVDDLAPFPVFTCQNTSGCVFSRIAPVDQNPVEARYIQKTGKFPAEPGRNIHNHFIDTDQGSQSVSESSFHSPDSEPGLPGYHKNIFRLCIIFLLCNPVSDITVRVSVSFLFSFLF